MENNQSIKGAIWAQAFRPLFLGGSLFSVLAIGIWISVLNGYWTFTPYANIVFWHAHEMLFGFVAAIVVGFLLTAIQNWTGLRATHGKPLIGLFTLWLIARILLVTNAIELGWFIAIIDISFLLMATGLAAQLVLKAHNYRNIVFIPILLLLAIANLLTHLSVILNKPELFSWGMHAAIMLITLVMTILGGRVIPLFTARGTQTPPAKPIALIEKFVLISTGVIALGFISNSISIVPKHIIAAVFATAALSHAWRAIRWYNRKIFSTPLIWSLHLANGFIPIGLALFSLHYLGFDISKSTALHGLTTGAMGSLILAMLARVSLGHSGRTLTPHPIMTLAFLLAANAGLLRLVAGVYPNILGGNGYFVSGIAWIIAYSIYCIIYFKILTTPRADGKPG
ncbi:MAG: heme-Cu protein NnrS [Alteromonadaceae bacterium]|nr:MAG: heme-Cu protein NnrS [Alteromonadaceae bacterium]